MRIALVSIVLLSCSAAFAEDQLEDVHLHFPALSDEGEEVTTAPEVAGSPPSALAHVPKVVLAGAGGALAGAVGGIAITSGLTWKKYGAAPFSSELYSFVDVTIGTGAGALFGAVSGIWLADWEEQGRLSAVLTLGGAVVGVTTTLFFTTMLGAASIYVDRYTYLDDWTKLAFLLGTAGAGAGAIIGHEVGRAGEGLWSLMKQPRLAMIPTRGGGELALSGSF